MNRSQTGAPDFLLMFLTIALLGFGLVMVFSSSSMTASYNYDNLWHFAIRQAQFSFMGVIALIVAFKIRMETWRKWTGMILIGSLSILFLVLIFGNTVKGAKSWFGFGSFGVQPTEFAKIGLIMFLAGFIAKKGDLIQNLKKGFIPALTVIFAFCLLIYFQPDVGAIMIILATAIVILFIGGIRLKHLFAIASLGAFIGFIVFTYKIATSENFFDSYRVQRFTSFMDPWQDPSGTGYQIIQSLYAFGHGGITGAGFGQSIQKLHYLPEAHNDFIFSIIGEEFGFLGSVFFLTLYFSFILRGFVVSIRQTDPYRMMVGVGFMTLITIQATVNLGGVTGLMPITGVTLPLISYGGSSLIATLFGVGLLLNVSREDRSSPGGNRWYSRNRKN